MNEFAPDGLPTIAVLCGGLATRLRPITEKIPKSLLEVAGEPFVCHQLRLLRNAGFERVVLLCGFLGEQIRDYIGSGSRFGLKVEYSFDGAQLLGTGGALKKALPCLGTEFMVVYGDSYLPTDYRRVFAAFRQAGRPALMAVFRNDNQWDRSNVEYCEGQIRRYEKGIEDAALNYIDYGLSAFRAEVFECLPEHVPIDLAAIQSRLAHANEMTGVEVFERFYEIGSPLGISQTEEYLRGLESTRPAETASKEDQP
jgi:NDP-sugar pyrophosphorylase family protein